MEVFGYLNVLIYVGALAIAYIVAKQRWFRRGKDERKYAPSVGCLPIIGSLPFMPAASDLPEWSLKKSSTLGGVFSYTIGRTYTVILTSHEAIREAMVQRSGDYPERVVRFGNRVMNPNAKGISFHQYNDEFKKYHQLTLSILRGFGFGERTMQTRINMEVEQVVNKIKAYNGKPFDPRHLMECTSYNVISRIMFGQPLDDSSHRDQRLLDLVGLFTVHLNNLLTLDVLPSLRFLPNFRKKINAAREYTNEMMDVIDQKIKESLNSETDESFVKIFVKKEGDNVDMEQLRYTIRDFLVAGSETVSASLEWALILLANHPDVQKRLQTEIDSTVPRDRPASFEELRQMTYVEAVILEVMRYKIVTPFALPHITMRDTEVGGYFVPKNTIIWTFMNVPHMNKKVWTDPTVFRPERFLDAAGDMIKRDLVIPFSMGKRSCIGEMMARQELFLALTTFLQQFNILPPEGASKIEVNAEKNMVPRPCHFEVRCLPRNVV